MILCPPDAQPYTIGRLLGILVLDEAEPLMNAGAMPSRPATAYLLGSGEFRQGRGKRLAPWALREIDRLAAVLTSKHSSYIDGVSDALKGGKSSFGLPPDDLIIKDPSGQVRVGPAPPQLSVDLSDSERIRWQLSWYQVLSQDYGRNRYLSHLSDVQLARRVEDIMANVHIISETGLVSLDSTDANLFYWMGRLQEVITEMTLRHGPYPAGWSRGFLDLSRLPGSLAASQLHGHQYLPGDNADAPVLVKYSRRQFIEDAYYHGKLRVAPAACYRDPSLNPAQQDDELVAEVDFNPFFSGIGHAPELDRMIIPNPRHIVRREVSSNYYIYCTAMALSTRLLLDFEAEVALVIHDPDAFLTRLDIAMRAQLPNWDAVAGPAQYYDPLQVTPEEVELPMWKHFRYAYQREFRAAWLPPSPITVLEPVMLEVGPLTDIAEIRIPESIRDLPSGLDIPVTRLGTRAETQ